MPETFGLRQRGTVKDREAAAREERRVARNQRRGDRAAGVLEPGPPVAPNEMEDLGYPEPDREEG